MVHYISFFDRVGTGPGLTWASRTGNAPVEYQEEPEKFKISCHPCGHVGFHDVGGRPKSIHCEPIYAITKKTAARLHFNP
jgi:hypothetical protein